MKKPYSSRIGTQSVSQIHSCVFTRFLFLTRRFVFFFLSSSSIHGILFVVEHAPVEIRSTLFGSSQKQIASLDRFTCNLEHTPFFQRYDFDLSSPASLPRLFSSFVFSSLSPCSLPSLPSDTLGIENTMFQLPNGGRSSRGTELSTHRTGYSSCESTHHRYNWVSLWLGRDPI